MVIRLLLCMARKRPGGRASTDISGDALRAPPGVWFLPVPPPPPPPPPPSVDAPRACRSGVPLFAADGSTIVSHGFTDTGVIDTGVILTSAGAQLAQEGHSAPHSTSTRTFLAARRLNDRRHRDCHRQHHDNFAPPSRRRRSLSPSPSRRRAPSHSPSSTSDADMD